MHDTVAGSHAFGSARLALHGAAASVPMWPVQPEPVPVQMRPPGQVLGLDLLNLSARRLVEVRCDARVLLLEPRLGLEHVLRARVDRDERMRLLPTQTRCAHRACLL